jgi:hypothetical protein
MKDEIPTNLEQLKKQYSKLQKQYQLPNFSELNKQFDVEEIDVETDFLLRKIRRNIAEKVAGYMRFIEIILNPQNTPLFLFKLIKKLESKDKEDLTKLYEKLGAFEIKLVSLDLDYNEKNEADFITKCFELFNQEIKTNLLALTEKMSNGNDNSKTNGASYFG